MVRIKTIAVICLSTSIFVGCSTTKSSSQEKPSTGQAAPSSSQQHQTNKASDNKTSGSQSSKSSNNNQPSTPNKQADSSSDNKTSNTSQAVPGHKQMNYLNGSAHISAQGTLYTNSSLNYFLYTLPKYTATQAGNKVLVSLNDQTYEQMTIETFSKGTDLQVIQNQAIASLKSLGKVNEVTTYRNDHFFQNGTILKVTNNNETKTAFILSIHGQAFKIIVTSNQSESVSPEWIAMIKSIQPKQ